MHSKDIYDKLKEVIEIKKSIKQDVLDYLENSDNDLEDRWNMLVTAGKELEFHDGMYFNPKGIDWDKHSLHDDFYIDKHQIYNVEYLLKKSKEDKFLEDEEAFKLDCVKHGYYSFENDW